MATTLLFTEPDSRGTHFLTLKSNYMSSLNEYEFNTEFELENEGELVHELLSVSNEQELENFLGDIWNAAKRVYNSPQGQAIKKDFVAGAKSFGKKMLPSVGRNLGQYIGGNTGANIGGKLAGAASNWLFNEVGETEAVDYLRVVRKAAKYLNKALSEGADGAPRSMVTQAINQAARPILSKRRGSFTSKKQGRWFRQGNQLVLRGAR
jgi:hypothetical protein